MRQRLAIIITIVVVIGVLVALSSASYVHVERTPDSEFSPDRSTMNSGATGTRAFYDFLHEAGYQVIRWREPPANLLNSRGIRPVTFVIVGRTRRPIELEEARLLLRWVANGGRLVIVDRLPEPALLPAGDWIITGQLSGNEPYGVSADNLEVITQGVSKLVPAQPTLLTNGVESIQPSRFVGVLKIAPNIKSAKPATKDSDGDNAAATEDEDPLPLHEPDIAPPPPPVLLDNPSAPVVHIAEKGGALLLDLAHGKGRIVLLAEPFLLANNGVSSADNLQLAINLVGGGNGLVAFDEFHQGRSASQNALLAYFAGTPVVAMCAQLALLVLVLIWTRGRRFARPLPLPQVDRRSSLEFVASMAELQERARAYDLALENIYLRTRRVLARYAGADNFSTRSEIARRVASRSRIDGNELETLMRNCEDVINGAPTSSQNSVQLAQRLRNLEGQLGLRMRSRDTRQAANKI
jgi:hypothetical protein